MCIVSTFLIFMFVYSWMCFSAVLSNLYKKTTKKYRFDKAISFIDFHRFPLSIDKNHMIATDFYQLITPCVLAKST